MTKPSGLFLLCLLAVGCGPQPYIDHKLQREIFMECLSHVPPGPQTTHYNDWDDVVDSCNNAAASQSWVTP